MKYKIQDPTSERDDPGTRPRNDDPGTVSFLQYVCYHKPCLKNR